SPHQTALSPAHATGVRCIAGRGQGRSARSVLERRAAGGDASVFRAKIERLKPKLTANAEAQRSAENAEKTSASLVNVHSLASSHPPSDQQRADCRLIHS